MSLHDHMEMIEKIQYQAALAVTGTWQGTSRVKIYEELGWESLSDRRISRRVLQMHKIIDEKTPKYLRDCLPPNRNIVLNLPYVFQEFKTRTDRYKCLCKTGIENTDHFLLQCPFYDSLRTNLRTKVLSTLSRNDLT